VQSVLLTIGSLDLCLISPGRRATSLILTGRLLGALFSAAGPCLVLVFDSTVTASLVSLWVVLALTDFAVHLASHMISLYSVLYEHSGALHEYAGTVCISSINAALMCAVVRLFYLGPGADLEQEMQRRCCCLIWQSPK
jgi:hypothetical protein